MAGWWKARGQLCCLLGLSPCRALIKSRPWCEAFCWGSGGSDPPWVWMCPRGRKLRKCLSLVYWIHCHSSGASQDSFSLITHRCPKPAQNIHFVVLLSFWISIIRSLFDAERNHVKVTGTTKRHSFVKAFIKHSLLQFAWEGFQW